MRGEPSLLSHHFIGTGRFSERLRADGHEPARLLARIAARVRDSGLEVEAATLDLHVCDFRESNAERARRLRDHLSELCFAPGGGEWREMQVGERATRRVREVRESA